MTTTTLYSPGSPLVDPVLLDQHNAIVSLKEELDAIDWYAQRAEQTTDAALKAILIHNKEEEMEHAVMLMEWLRRSSPAFDAHARKYLFTSGSITVAEAGSKIESDIPGKSPALVASAASGSLGIGSLKSAAWTS
mgnify:CR=1 FL=1